MAAAKILCLEKPLSLEPPDLKLAIARVRESERLSVRELRALLLDPPLTSLPALSTPDNLSPSRLIDLTNLTLFLLRASINLSHTVPSAFEIFLRLSFPLFVLQSISPP